MYHFESERKSGWEHAFVISFAVGAIVLYAISGMENAPLPWLFQLGTVLLLGVFAYFLVRYELKQYRYELCDSGIRDDQGQVRLELVVTEQVGKKQTVVARVGLWQIDRVAVLDKNNKKKDVCGGKTAFIYDNRLFAEKRLAVRMTGTDPVVIIPYDEGMMNALNTTENQTGEAL